MYLSLSKTIVIAEMNNLGIIADGIRHSMVSETVTIPNTLELKRANNKVASDLVV